MLAVAGLVGISFIWSVTSFTAGPLLPRTRSVGDLRNQHQQRHSLNQHQQRHSLAERRQQPSSAEPAVAAIWPQEQHQRQPRLLHRITTRLAAAPAGESEAEATTTAPRLKRVRKRRKDPASIPTAGDEDEGIEGDGVGAVAAAVSPIAEEVPAVAQAAAAATTSAAEEIRSQVAQTFQEESPRSAGGTKGTRVRVDNSDSEMGEKFEEVASAASGAAGGAATAVSGAAKSVMGAAMLFLGQGGENGGSDDFDFDSVPSIGAGGGGGRSRTTPGKSASELSDLGADIERFRSRENRQPKGPGEALTSGAKDIISKIIAVDFFVVIAFMLWFIAGVVSSYGFKETFLLDQFNEKWTPVVQPALGVLMGGTIAGGVASKVSAIASDPNEDKSNFKR